MSIGQKIRELREAAKLSQPALAQKAKVSQQLISSLESGKIETTKKLPEIAAALGVEPPVLDPRYGGAYTPPPRFFSEDRNLPVYAAAEGGGGHIIVSTDAIEFQARPYILESVPDAYGILITGDSMIPAFEPGDTAWVNPKLPPMRDVDVILYQEDGHGEAKATIKRLIGWTTNEWHLRQYNPPKDFKLRREEWPKIHRVVGKFSRR